MIKSEGEGASAEKLNEAIDCLWEEAGKAWLDMNSLLFCHALEYQNKMSEFLTESNEAIEALHDRIWSVVMKVMEDAGKPMADGLGIAMRLVDMLPTIPLHLAFHLSTPGLIGFMPEVYAAWPKSRMDILDFSHMSPLQSSQKALDVLCEEIVKNVCGATEKEKAVEPTWLMAVADMSTVGVKAAEVGASDGPTSSPHASHSSIPHTFHSTIQHSQTRSPSPHCHSQSSRSSSSSSGSSSRSGNVSGSSSSGSSQLGSGDESHTGSRTGSHAGSQALSEGSSSGGSEYSHSTSPEVVLVQGDDEDTAVGGEDAGHSEDEEALSQGTVSLLDISTSDNEEACKAAAHETACKSDIQYGIWQDEQIYQGNEGITQCDKQVNDYTNGGRPSKAPDKIGPPLSYMEECGVFKPLDTIVNPLGLCSFYWTDPQKSNVVWDQSLQLALTGLSTCWS